MDPGEFGFQVRREVRPAERAGRQKRGGGGGRGMTHTAELLNNRVESKNV